MSYYRGGWRWRGVGFDYVFINDGLEVNGICRLIELLGRRSYERSDVEVCFLSFRIY